MSTPPDPFAFLQSIIHLSNTPLPIESKLDQMLQSISSNLGSDRCLLIKPEEMVENGFFSRLAREKRPLWVDEGELVYGEDVLSEEKKFLSPSFVCIPLNNQTTFYGLFHISYPEKRKFSSQEMNLHLLVSSIVENTLSYHDTFNRVQEHEKMVGELSTLLEINQALLNTVNFERIIHITLTAITIGKGLGFNRAMLFMVNEKTQSLEGTMAVGPDSAEEAGRIWTTLSQRQESLSDLVSQLPLSSDRNGALNALVKGIQIPLEQEQCILSRTVTEERPLKVQFPDGGEGRFQTPCQRGCHLGSEVGCYVGEHLSLDPKVYSFVTVPLWGKGKVIGLILVDNLYNQNPITEKHIQFLSMVSHQAGLAIENAILYRNLEEVHQTLKETQTLLVNQEKMAALGELSSTIAHEIRNPLVSIGGFARRLYRTIPDEAPEKRYTQTIMNEVSRLEKILTDLFHYTREGPLSLKALDLQVILEESLRMALEEIHHEGIQIVKAFSEPLPRVMGNHHQLKQSFFNLISNALQVMNGQGTLSLRIYSVLKNGATSIQVEVEDTGGGIDPENLHNIFNPFYTTKGSSLGLGLPIVHKIVTSYHGQIEVDNRPGKGVTFIVTFPVPEEGRRE